MKPYEWTKTTTKEASLPKQLIKAESKGKIP
jgi:hypothetical protein